MTTKKMPAERNPITEMGEAITIRENLHAQIDSFLSVRERRLTGQAGLEAEGPLNRQQEYLNYMLKGILDERIARSAELQSPELQEAIEIALSMFPEMPSIIDCVDGRMPATIMFGLTLGMSRGIRRPAGNVPGFYYDHTQNPSKLTLDHDSDFAKLVRKQNGRRNKFEMYGSHLACAAQNGEETAAGSKPADAGLYRNILLKRKKGEVIEEDLQIIPIQYSFDPQNGYLYMGLEKDEALRIAEQNGNSFVPKHDEGDREAHYKTLNMLVDTGVIISTQKLAEQFESEFVAHEFDIDWAGKYKESALSFWRNMKSMESTVLPRIRDMVAQTFNKKMPEDDDEIQMRAVALLSNSFNGWLQNRQGPYPFDTHEEQCVVIDWKSKGPFKDYPALVIAPEQESIGASTFLAQSIVRANRAGSHERTGVVDRSHVYDEHPDEYLTAPTVVIYKEEIKELRSDNPIWNTLREIDWKEPVLIDGEMASMQDVWMRIPQKDFETWLKNQLTGIPLGSWEAIMTTYDRMRANMVETIAYEQLRKLTYRGGIIIVPLLVSSDRQPQTIVPFIS
jgi:hypothetical protein